MLVDEFTQTLYYFASSVLRLLHALAKAAIPTHTVIRTPSRVSNGMHTSRRPIATVGTHVGGYNYVRSASPFPSEGKRRN
jgi:hypothetical protein